MNNRPKCSWCGLFDGIYSEKRCINCVLNITSRERDKELEADQRAERERVLELVPKQWRKQYD